MLTRESILAARLPTATVAVPAWGGSVTIRALTLAELEAWRAVQADAARAAAGEGLATLVRLSVVDASGHWLFGDADVPALAAQAPVMIAPLVEAILRLNGLDAASRDAAAGN